MFQFIVKHLLKKIFSFFLISALATSFTLAQKVKIKKILDSNLFELTDGRLIKLAGVDVPNINHKNTDLRKVGIEAFKYAQRTLKGKRFELIYTKKIPIDTNYSLVHIIKEYLLQTRDFSNIYLERGFGKFIPNIDTSYFREYLSTEIKAKKGKEGIWKIDNNYKNDILDKTFYGAELLTEKAIDSIAIYPLSKPFVINTSQPVRIVLEIFAAPLVGIPSTFIGALLGGGIGGLATRGNSSGHGGIGPVFGYVILGGYIGFIAGNGIGVYYVAKDGERDIALGYTILASFIGAASGIVISMTTDKFSNNVGNYAPLFLPTVASIIYANLIAPKKVVGQTVAKSSKNNLIFRKTNLTHQDFYNSTKLFEMNLFKINF